MRKLVVISKNLIERISSEHSTREVSRLDTEIRKAIESLNDGLESDDSEVMETESRNLTVQLDYAYPFPELWNRERFIAGLSLLERAYQRSIGTNSEERYAERFSYFSNHYDKLERMNSIRGKFRPD